MEIRHAVHPEQAKHFTTEELREHFLVQEVFRPNAVKLVYSYYDRLIVGGVCPTGPLTLAVDEKVIGSSYLLERREMGVINIGGSGAVSVDGKPYELDTRDSLYIGMGSKDIVFSSNDTSNPAKFYLNCAPAHKAYPTEKIALTETEPLHLGSIEKSNERTIYKYIQPDGVKSCQLVMGMTILEPNNVWNTMSAHTHQRRMEAYLYFNIPGDEVVFHFMGEPGETRHIVVRNEEAVLSPSWSIHSGAGTQNYVFIWGMAGENQAFTDMDDVPMAVLK
jgi:4-deoxy-L-threo-5-hexosulose-uronate ketol-isomerase